MEALTEIVAYVKTHWYMILMTGSVFLLFAEMVTSLTPTKSDDLFVERVAKGYRKVLEFFKVPNIKKKDGSYIIPEGKHEPRK
jgi:hypothetical protein